MKLPSVSVVLLSVLLSGAATAKGDDEMLCLDETEIAARLNANDRNKKRLTRVTNPSTASTEFRKRMPIVTGQEGGFERFKSLQCNTKLCFNSTAPSQDDPFVDLEFIAMNDGHHPYDRVLEMAGEEEPYLMTTLRDPVDYCVNNYKRKAFWDGPTPGIKEMTFVDWLDQVSWRANQLTRLMGRSDGNERVVATIVDPRPSDQLKADEYMKQQNSLGADSEILQTAWERMQKLHWFGLFHRLRESMELLGFTFCADTEELLKYYTRPAKSTGNIDKLNPKYVGDISDEEKEKLVTEILERNRLDAILFERAEALFDERLEEMKAAKENGVLCRFAGTVDVTCDDDGSGGDDSHGEL